MRRPRLAAALVTAALLLAGCSDEATTRPTREDVVVVYVALDQVHSEPILEEFERQTGIRVLPVYDAEAAKTVGLVNRLIARRDRPECDVFWNNEVLQTERLAQMGLLEPYASPSAQRIPAAMRDPQGRWTPFAARLRVVIYNTERIASGEVPVSLRDLADPARRGQAAIAKPFFGTTLTHMIALQQEWGPERLEAYLAELRANDVALAPGNGPVRDLVAAGDRAFGLTDTDDAWSAMRQGKPVAVAIPDPQAGAILIPNTVAMVRGCPHADNARRLIDYLLSAEVERRLAECDSAQIPLGTDLANLETPWRDLLREAPPRTLDVAAAAASTEAVVELLRRAGMDE